MANLSEITKNIISRIRSLGPDVTVNSYSFRTIKGDIVRGYSDSEFLDTSQFDYVICFFSYSFGQAEKGKELKLINKRVIFSGDQQIDCIKFKQKDGYWLEYEDGMWIIRHMSNFGTILRDDIFNFYKYKEAKEKFMQLCNEAKEQKTS